MPRLSVIVPIYKVEPFIDRCIRSILEQTYKDFELILVDDGSPDRCGEICDEYALNDNRIRVLHGPNGGLSHARNVGVAAAIGQLCCFIDSDDYIAYDTFEGLISCMDENNLDIVTGDAYVVKELNVSFPVMSDKTGKLDIYEHDEALGMALQGDFTASWGKIYKMDIIKQVKFPEGRLFEDSAVAHLFNDLAQRVGKLHNYYFYYYRNPNSISNSSFNVKARYDFLLAFEERLEYARKRDICVEESRALVLKAALSCLTALYCCDDKEKYVDIYKDIDTVIRENRHDNIYSNFNLKYKVFLWCYGRMDYIHIVGSYLSLYAKKLKKILK